MRFLMMVKASKESEAPFKEGEIEIRQLFELDEFTPGPAIQHHRKLQEKLRNS